MPRVKSFGQYITEEESDDPRNTLRQALPGLGFTLSTDFEHILFSLHQRTMKVLGRRPTRGEMRAVINGWIAWAKKKETGSEAIGYQIVRTALNDYSKTRTPLKEDAAGNAAGTGAVAGLGVGPKGEPGVKRKKYESKETFAGSPVFEVDMDTVMKARYGKNRYHRYSRYVGEDERGETIRQHGRSTKDDIILKDSTTNVMMYLRRRKK